MILADTSAWIEFDRKTGSDVNVRLKKLLPEPGGLAVTEPVIAEVLIGATNDEREAALRRLLGRCVLLSFQSPGDFDGAVKVYRQCRAASLTPRGLLDCLIAAVAIRHDVPVLAQDADLARIAAVTGLRLDEASLRVN
jgi:predicted nucleic acid-binding protein